MISSINAMLVKIGPFLKKKSLVFMLNTDVPIMSEGIRSGVNWILENSEDMVFDNTRALNVFATPGTPSSKTCPPVNTPINKRSIISCCPIMKRSTSPLTSSTFFVTGVRSMRLDIKVSSFFSCGRSFIGASCSVESSGVPSAP